MGIGYYADIDDITITQRKHGRVTFLCEISDLLSDAEYEIAWQRLHELSDKDNEAFGRPKENDQ